MVNNFVSSFSFLLVRNWRAQLDKIRTSNISSVDDEIRTVGLICVNKDRRDDEKEEKQRRRLHKGLTQRCKFYVKPPFLETRIQLYDYIYTLWSSCCCFYCWWRVFVWKWCDWRALCQQTVVSCTEWMVTVADFAYTDDEFVIRTLWYVIYRTYRYYLCTDSFGLFLTMMYGLVHRKVTINKIEFTYTCDHCFKLIFFFMITQLINV